MEFDHTESGTVTFEEDKRTHCTRMNEREWKLGLQNVDDLYEYKNLEVAKNYIGSAVSDVNGNVEKTRKKAGMIFSPNFDRCQGEPTYLCQLLEAGLYSISSVWNRTYVNHS